MKLPELKELAKQMGLRGTSTMRKPELLATLQGRAMVESRRPV